MERHTQVGILDVLSLEIMMEVFQKCRGHRLNVRGVCRAFRMTWRDPFRPIRFRISPPAKDSPLHELDFLGLFPGSLITMDFRLQRFGEIRLYVLGLNAGHSVASEECVDDIRILLSEAVSPTHLEKQQALASKIEQYSSQSLPPLGDVAMYLAGRVSFRTHNCKCADQRNKLAQRWLSDKNTNVSLIKAASQMVQIVDFGLGFDQALARSAALTLFRVCCDTARHTDASSSNQRELLLSYARRALDNSALITQPAGIAIRQDFDAMLLNCSVELSETNVTRIHNASTCVPWLRDSAPPSRAIRTILKYMETDTNGGISSAAIRWFASDSARFEADLGHNPNSFAKIVTNRLKWENDTSFCEPDASIINLLTKKVRVFHPPNRLLTHLSSNVDILCLLITRLQKGGALGCKQNEFIARQTMACIERMLGGFTHDQIFKTDLVSTALCFCTHKTIGTKALRVMAGAASTPYDAKNEGVKMQILSRSSIYVLLRIAKRCACTHKMQLLGMRVLSSVAINAPHLVIQLMHQQAVTKTCIDIINRPDFTVDTDIRNESFILMSHMAALPSARLMVRQMGILKLVKHYISSTDWAAPAQLLLGMIKYNDKDMRAAVTSAGLLFPLLNIVSNAAFIHIDVISILELLVSEDVEIRIALVHMNAIPILTRKMGSMLDRDPIKQKLGAVVDSLKMN